MRAAVALVVAATTAAIACTGEIGSQGGLVGGPAAPGDIPGPGGPGTSSGVCKGLSARVSRLTDRQLANAVRDLLGLSKTPAFETGSGGKEEFMPVRPAAVSGGVALKLRDVAEVAAVEATAAGKPAATCAGGDERACAKTFVERFAPRAFRRPITVEERDALLSVYDVGRQGETHAVGIRTVIEAALQSPSFIYLRELGDAADGDAVALTPYEIATKLSLFLRDSIPDDALWSAAESGKIATPEGLDAEIDRLLGTPEVRANVTSIFERLFQLDRISTVAKDASVKEFTPAFADSLRAGTRKFLEEILWGNGGQDAKLKTLLTSSKVFVDKNLAPVYGATASGDGLVAVDLPNRAGILTQPSMLTIEATPSDSSVVHRGVFVLRELLCFHPPPPQADDLAQGDELKKNLHTERARAEKRATIPRCAGCHSFIDPLGVSFEHFDTLGRYRTEISTPDGPVPVDASWDFSVYDVKGRVANSTELASRLAESDAVKTCLVRQFASYALGERLGDDQVCTTAKVKESFTGAEGDLLSLIKAVARWEALRTRDGGAR